MAPFALNVKLALPCLPLILSPVILVREGRTLRVGGGRCPDVVVELDVVALVVLVVLVVVVVVVVLPGVPTYTSTPKSSVTHSDVDGQEMPSRNWSAGGTLTDAVLHTVVPPAGLVEV